MHRSACSNQTAAQTHTPDSCPNLQRPASCRHLLMPASCRATHALACRDHDTLSAVHHAVTATSQPAAVRGQTLYHELPKAGHWVGDGLLSALLPATGSSMSCAASTGRSEAVFGTWSSLLAVWAWADHSAHSTHQRASCGLPLTNLLDTCLLINRNRHNRNRRNLLSLLLALPLMAGACRQPARLGAGDAAVAAGGGWRETGRPVR